MKNDETARDGDRGRDSKRKTDSTASDGAGDIQDQIWRACQLWRGLPSNRGSSALHPSRVLFVVLRARRRYLYIYSYERANESRRVAEGRVVFTFRLTA